MKRVMLNSFLMLTNLLLLVHLIVPHHHHSEQVCFQIEYSCQSAQEHAANTETQHSTEACFLKSVLLTNQQLTQKQSVELKTNSLFLFNQLADSTNSLFFTPLFVRLRPFLPPPYLSFVSSSLGLRAPPYCS